MAPVQLPGLAQPRQQQGAGAGGDQRGGSRASSSGSSSRGAGSSGGGGSGAAEALGPACEVWLRALKSAGPAVERRLASLRLHLPEWGTDAAPLAPPELAAAAGGRCDVRAAAALVALAEAAAGAPALDSGDGSGSGGAAAAAAEAARLMALRAQQLLGGFPTSADEDAALLEGGRVRGLMAEVVAFRLAKKQVLSAIADSGAAAGGGGSAAET
jgi:hypothetical protein